MANADPWAAVPRSLIPHAAHRLKSRYSIMVWLAYATYANRETGEAWPTKETIARLIGHPIRLRDVRRCIDELIAAGMLANAGTKLIHSRHVIAYFVLYPGATAPGAVDPTGGP